MFDEQRKYSKRHLAKFIQFDDRLNLPSTDGDAEDGSEEKKNLKIPTDQFRRQLESMRGSLNLTDRQISVLVNYADENKDGYVSFDEFQRLITSSEAQDSSLKRMLYTVADPVITPSQEVTVHSYLDEYNCCPPPIFLIFITLVEIAVFFGYYFSTADSKCNLSTCCPGCFLNGTPGPLIFTPSRKAQVWRFYTYSLLHDGIVHLLSNVVVQLLVGVPLELVHKPWRIAIIYILSVIIGCMLQYVVDPRVSLVGASGGVYSLITAHLANVFLNWSEMPLRWLRLLLAGGYVIFDFGFSIYYLSGCEVDNVSVAAHLGGALIGLFMGVFVLYNVEVKKFETIVRYVFIALFVIIVVILIIVTILRAPFSAPIISRPLKCT